MKFVCSNSFAITWSPGISLSNAFKLHVMVHGAARAPAYAFVSTQNYYCACPSWRIAYKDALRLEIRLHIQATSSRPVPFVRTDRSAEMCTAPTSADVSPVSRQYTFRLLRQLFRRNVLSNSIIRVLLYIYKFSVLIIERVSVEVTIRIRDVPGSNLGRDCGTSWFFSFLPRNCRNNTPNRPRPLPSTSFPIYQTYIHSTL
jgi:hypothetical protein